jgi:hypothetical protein
LCSHCGAALKPVPKSRSGLRTCGAIIVFSVAVIFGGIGACFLVLSVSFAPSNYLGVTYAGTFPWGLGAAVIAVALIYGGIKLLR